MKNSIKLQAIASAACALAAASSPATATAATVGDSWYMLPQVSVMMPDHAIDTKNQAGVGLKFGRTISPEWDLQLGVTEARSRDQYHQSTGGADFLYMPMRSQAFRPFALAGMGVEYDRSAATERRVLPYVGLGMGMQYAFTRRLGMQLDLRRNFGILRTDGPDPIRHINTTYATVGLTYAFGDDPKPPPPVRQTSTYIAPPPPPEPPAVVVAPPPPPPPPRTERLTLSASELFAFDSARLNPPQPKLDELAEQITSPGAKAGNVVVRGYTDRLGSPAYNKRLSQQRADAVKAYLAGKGVPSDRVSAVGNGSADPVAECKQRMSHTALVKCLEPNRRVVIEPVVVERTMR